MIPFKLTDDPDNRYEQIYTPMREDPYSDAGIKGFNPTQPFKESELSPALSGLTSSEDIISPSLADLNTELFDWNEGEEETVLANDSLCVQVEMFNTTAVTSPLPPTIDQKDPSVPLIGPLTTNIMAGFDKLFFISHRVPDYGVTEWSLVRVALRDSLRKHPNALQYGRFLVDFYTFHPKEKLFNAINQRYWLTYHPITTNSDPLRQRNTHLLHPSAESPNYANAQGLCPFRRWVCLTNSDTFIPGPFNFAIVNNRKS